MIGSPHPPFTGGGTLDPTHYDESVSRAYKRSRADKRCTCNTCPHCGGQKPPPPYPAPFPQWFPSLYQITC